MKLLRCWPCCVCAATPGAEALGIGFTAAWLQAAPGLVLAGGQGRRPWRRWAPWPTGWPTGPRPWRPAKPGRHAVGPPGRGPGLWRALCLLRGGGRMQVCYDGEAFRRVLAMPAGRARPARPRCPGPDAARVHRPRPACARARWGAGVAVRRCSSAWRLLHCRPICATRVQMRRAMVWSALAYQQARTATFMALTWPHRPPGR